MKRDIEPRLSGEKLKITEFGNGTLRTVARSASKDEVSGEGIQRLIRDMRYTLSTLKLGVGLAAPQVGQGLALAVIDIKPTKLRPNVETFDLVLINPQITETVGRKKQLREGCMSGGSGRVGLFAKVPRYNKVKVKYMDEKGKTHHQSFQGLPAHVIQHEIDHLMGILFVDRVKDTKTFMTYNEYMKLKPRSGK